MTFIGLSCTRYAWHYRAWQQTLAGYLVAFSKNYQPHNNMIGFVINDKHPKTIRVQCERWLYSVRYKKSFRVAHRVWAHDEDGLCKLGDIVKIQPMGLGPWKRFVLVHVLYHEPQDFSTNSSLQTIHDAELSDLENDTVLNENLRNNTVLSNQDTPVSTIITRQYPTLFRQKDYKNIQVFRPMIPFLRRHQL